MIVAFSGLAGSGKDTAADYLVKHKGFVKVALADPLKRICADVFDFTKDQLWGPSDQRNVPDKRYFRRRDENEFGDDLGDIFLTPRYALQQLGTQWGRDCYDPIWIKYALRVHERLQMGGCYYDAMAGLRQVFAVGGPMVRAKTDVVISDVRFKNEVKGLRDAGARVVRIVRPEAGLQGAAGQHLSEKEQLEIPDTAFDAVILNNSTLTEFYSDMLKAVGL